MTAVEKWHGDCSVGEERPLSSPVVASSVGMCKPWLLIATNAISSTGVTERWFLGDFKLGSLLKMFAVRSKKV